MIDMADCADVHVREGSVEDGGEASFPLGGSKRFGEAGGIAEGQFGGVEEDCGGSEEEGHDVAFVGVVKGLGCPVMGGKCVGDGTRSRNKIPKLFLTQQII